MPEALRKFPARTPLWTAAIVLVVLIALGTLSWFGLETKDPKDRVDVALFMAQAFAGLALAGGLIFTWLNMRTTQENVRTTQDNANKTLDLATTSQISERFTRAIDQLGNQYLWIRLGGIIGLGRVAADSEAYRGPILDVLTAYVREHDRTPSPWLSPHDVQWILRILGDGKTFRRTVDDGETSQLGVMTIDLSKADLHLMDLSSLNLENVSLAGAHLERVNFGGTNLDGVDLKGAHLEGSSLTEAQLQVAKSGGATGIVDTPRTDTLDERGAETLDLRGRDLSGNDLRQKNLVDAKLQGANLAGVKLSYGAILRGADLKGTNLAGADLRGVDLGGVANLTLAQFRSAITDSGTTPPRYFETRGIRQP